jgi:hypothetical protein
MLISRGDFHFELPLLLLLLPPPPPPPPPPPLPPPPPPPPLSPRVRMLIIIKRHFRERENLLFVS